MSMHLLTKQMLEFVYNTFSEHTCLVKLATPMVGDPAYGYVCTYASLFQGPSYSCAAVWVLVPSGVNLTGRR